MPTPTYLWLQQVAQSPGVRAKCDEVAKRVAAAVTSITASDGFGGTAQVTVSSGTRPRGRPYSTVDVGARTDPEAAQDISQATGGANGSSAVGGTEFGTAVSPRTRLLGRAVSAARNPRARIR